MRQAFKALIPSSQQPASNPENPGTQSSEGRHPGNSVGHDKARDVLIESRRESSKYGLLRVDDKAPERHSANGTIDVDYRYDVDFVFIHGLKGHREHTWTNKEKQKKFWPRDKLPVVVPGARIYSYGYPSEIFATRSRAGVEDFASNLLGCLNNEYHHQADHEAARPIIFVCHSLGGLVFKQAMILAHSKDIYRRVWLNCKGVVFMGTPHRGSEVAELGTVFLQIARSSMNMTLTRLFKGGVRADLVKILQPNSPLLVAIADEFLKIPLHGLRIKTFYETEAHPILNTLIVDKTSASLGLEGEDVTALYANHENICRFGPDDEDRFQEVSTVLRTMAKAIMAETSQQAPGSLSTDRTYDSMERLCIRELDAIDVPGIEAALDPWTEGTLHWILECSEFISWDSDPNTKLLWITGHPGCGKTTMSSYVRGYLAQNQQTQSVLCRFFCNTKVDEQRSGTAILRSLLSQIIDQRRRLVGVIKKALQRAGNVIFSRFEALWELLSRLLISEEIPETRIIIDGIDECDQASRTMLIRKFSSLLKTQSSSRIKVLITSRPNIDVYHSVNLPSHSWACLSLEECAQIISEDIEIVVQKKLDILCGKGVCKPNSREVLKRMLVAKADCTFLWLTLIFDAIEGRRMLLARDMEALIESLPAGLDETYGRLLESIPQEDCETAARMLRVIVASKRPLTGCEIGSFFVLLSGDSSTQGEFGVDERTVVSVLGPLIRVHDSKIYLLHQSLREYLIELGQEDTKPLSAAYGIDIDREEIALFHVCTKCLLDTDMMRPLIGSMTVSAGSSGSPSDSSDDDRSDLFGGLFDSDNLAADGLFSQDTHTDGGTWQTVKEKHPLFDYAALHWTDHFKSCDSDLRQQDQDAFAKLCENKGGRSMSWFRYHWFRKHKHIPMPTIIDRSIVAAFFGYANMLDNLLREMNSEKLSLDRALYWAARQGNSQCVQVLLKLAQLNINSKDIEMQTPLTAAAQNGHITCVRSLLSRKDVDVNATSEKGRTPLSIAAGHGHLEIVNLLLPQMGIALNHEDYRGQTALFWAVSANSLPVVERFLSVEGTEQNHLDKSQRNVMSWAAEDGIMEMVRLLLRFPKVEPDQRDIRGRTPFNYAAQKGHLDVMRHLLNNKHCHRRIDPLSRDHSGRNAHSWAASHGGSDVLNFLLRRVPEGADVPDQSGWTPLFWALDPPGYPNRIFALLEAAQVDVNQKDEFGKTCLMWAAEYGYYGVVNRLVEIQATDIEARSNGGKTALSFAAGSGSIEVLDCLLSRAKVDVNSRDRGGMTPLLWAASQGHPVFVQRLLEESQVDFCLTDHMGQSALDLAVKHQHDTVAALLRHDMSESTS